MQSCAVLNHRDPPTVTPLFYLASSGEVIHTVFTCGVQMSLACMCVGEHMFMRVKRHTEYVAAVVY